MASENAMRVDLTAVFAEFIAMLLFVFICCGSATGVAGDDGWVQQVSLTFGLCITCLAYTVGHHSGGQINCAVTFGLVLARKLNVLQGIANLFGQILGSLAGAALLALMVPPNADKTGTLGTNTVGPNYSVWHALVGEICMTFILVYVVLETAVSEKSADNRRNAAIAIGFAVYLAHSILIPIDGCSINPTRSFGPAVVASVRYGHTVAKVDLFWRDHLVFWVGPLLGAALAVGVYFLVQAAPGSSNADQSQEQQTEGQVVGKESDIIASV